MSGKTLTLHNIVKVPTVQQQTQPESSDEITLESINRFIANLRTLINESKELITTLAENADKLMLPAGLAQKLQTFKQGITSNPATLPAQFKAENLIEGLEMLKSIKGNISLDELIEIIKQHKDDINLMLGGKDVAKADSGGKEG